ncbi:MAG: hypothetical protein HY290_30195, partial [Planctomycetia bacterium]|nr:hypothetical protein [Planctomycetia bacterium]
LLRDPEGPARFPFPGLELIGEARREVTEKGKKRLEIELTLRVAGGSRGETVSIWIRVDPASKLPDSFAMLADDGKRYTATIDYPEQGPADIYGLGAPRNAKVVDRSLPEEVVRVMAELKAGRREFGDYSAFVVEERLLPTNYLPMTMVYRVQRKGEKWRIDELRPGRLEWAPPADADKAWWSEHHEEFKFIPRVICDGKVYWDYYFRDEWKPGVPIPKPGKPNAIGQTVGPNQFLGQADDPVLPFWCQDLLPEYAGHPSAGLWEPAGDREFLVDAKASGGPPETILFRGRDPISPAGMIADHFRSWLDPAADHLSMRTEIRIHDRNDITKVAYIDSHVVEAREKSPQGRWYPLQVRHIAHNGQHELVRKFFVDFEAKLADELFQPLE